jgi:hypothetical protein
MRSISRYPKGRISGKRVLLRACLLILVLAALAVPIGRADAGTNDYAAYLRDARPDSLIDPWRFYNRECTSFVAWRLNSRNRFPFQNDLNGDGRLVLQP